MRLQCGDHTLDLSTPAVMGVLNVTPDSFSDGGRFLAADAAVRQAWRMIEDGARLIDIGGESTRPGSEPVDGAEELRRIRPVIEALAGKVPVPLSVDTSKPEVMRAAIGLGAGMINDVRALREPDAIATVARSKAAVCLMHMRGEPRSMQREPRYTDVVQEVRDFLEERIAVCEAGGIARDRLVVDAGFGFGKALQHNLELLRGLTRIASLGVPVLAGLSRKSMIGTILEKPVEQRVIGGVALATLAVTNGARIIRTHDVAATIDAVRIAAVVGSDTNREGDGH